MERTEQGERRAAVRALLARPLLHAKTAGDEFRLVVRHRQWLTRWFAEKTGWKLLVEPRAGWARLHKVPARRDATRPAASDDRPPFDRRRYVLLCITLAEVADCAAQTTLARLAERVHELSVAEIPAQPFDPEMAGERRAFVDALRLLGELGVLTLRDGDAERYAASRTADALYDVDERLVAQLVAAPVPPALAADPAALVAEAYPQTEEGERQRARHAAMRLLLDEPVVYYDDLPAAQRDWIAHSLGHLHEVLREDVGLALERRREGLAAVDGDGTLTDELFPDGGSTTRHAALLLCQLLAEAGARDPAAMVPETLVAAWVGGFAAAYAERCGWRADYEGEAGVARLATDAMALLERFGLVRAGAGGWRPLPAVARFRPRAPRE
jgi:uncharacterized protein (TIGR02678 family)